MTKCGTVGSCIFRNLNFLKKLSKTKSEAVKRKLIANASVDEITCLVESSFNILNSNFLLSNKNLKKLKPFSKTVKQLAVVRNSEKAKKILQKGHGFPFEALLLPILITALK